jgi:glycosyltransferase involved in cell wall biosynthesis
MAAWQRRLPLLLKTLDPSAIRVTSGSTLTDFATDIASVADVTNRSHMWLILSTLSGRFPDEETVIETSRRCELDGPGALWAVLAELTTEESAGWDVRVASGLVLADVAHTVSTQLTTGIQRVARETVRRWVRDRKVTPVSWTRDFQAIRELTTPERHRLMRNTPTEDRGAPADATVLVPWDCTYALLELAAETERTKRLLAMARFSKSRTGVVGFDCVPLTTAETTQEGFSALFARNLAAVRYMDKVAAISEAAGEEYAGWRAMLPAIGIAGPEVRPIPLPVDTAEPTAEAVEKARQGLGVGRLPLVLVVGSHEPRKNHLAILHAAELLWREGQRFTLAFLGGNAWGSGEFRRRVAELQAQGRQVRTLTRLPDNALWATYRLARCTVFPSFNEGFGLPVAESLASGTPVITSSFGSMLKLSADGGALTIDPYDDAALADALRSLLTDERLHARLTGEAGRRTVRTWDDYAQETWEYLVGQPARKPGGGRREQIFPVLRDR